MALDFKPGIYLYQHTLLYVRIGVSINELALQETVIAKHDPGNQQLQIHSQTSEEVYPFRLGIGLERQFHKNYSVVFDYVYAQYRDISTSGHNQQTFPPTVIIDTHSAATDITRQTAMLGFNYYFQ